MKSTQSEEKMQPQGGKTQHAQDDMKAGPKGEKSAQDNNMSNARATRRTACAQEDESTEGREAAQTT